MRIVLLALLLAATSCVRRGLVNPPAVEKLKTVAIVQFAENWGESRLFLGGSTPTEKRVPTYTQTWDLFVQEFGSRWKMMPRTQLQSHPEYLRVAVENPPGHPELPKPFRALPGPGRDVAWAMLSKENAAKVAVALNVDAVIALSLSFAITVTDRGGLARNTYYVNMYDRAGTLIWNDEVVGASQLDEYLTVIHNPYNIYGSGVSVADAPEKWTKQNASACSNALEKLKQHLEHPPPEYLPPK